jgi:hypothetical protein
MTDLRDYCPICGHDNPVQQIDHGDWIERICLVCGKQTANMDCYYIESEESDDASSTT